MNSKSPLALCDFSNFDLSYYPEAASGEPSTREQMAKIFQFCRRYAKTFSSDSSNLLMSGEPALEKLICLSLSQRRRWKMVAALSMVPRRIFYHK